MPGEPICGRPELLDSTNAVEPIFCSPTGLLKLASAILPMVSFWQLLKTPMIEPSWSIWNCWRLPEVAPSTLVTARDFGPPKLVIMDRSRLTAVPSARVIVSPPAV